MQLMILVSPEKAGSFIIVENDEVVKSIPFFIPDLIDVMTNIIVQYPQIESIYITQQHSNEFLNVLIEKIRSVTNKPIIIGEK